MIKFQDLDLTDIKLHTASSELGFDKVAFGDEVIWQKSTSPLPVGYTRVKYLQSSGKQCINTGKSIAYVNSSNVTFVVNFAMTNVVSIQIIFGATYGVGSGEKQLVFITKKMRGDYVKPNYGTYYSTIVQEDVVYTFEQTETDCIFNGEALQITYRVSIDALFTLFGRGTVNGATPSAYCKIFDFILKEDGVLAMNFIPCLDPNNTPCFYDTVSQQPFYNAGRGKFGYETMDGTIVAPT